MIFKSLTLKNFRVFNGLHTIELSPKREDMFVNSPVILFGGLNGAGKTSILTAIRLVLLGKLAIGQLLTKKEYANFLSEQTNKTALKDDPETIAEISLLFTHTHMGKHNSYRLTRRWDAQGKETLSLDINDSPEQSMNSEQAQSFINGLIPPGIANLFFFDGEKIAELAEDETGSYLKDAVQKLLGIDLVNRLDDDLDIYIKQLTTEGASKTSASELSELEADKTRHYVQAEKFRETADEIHRKISGLRTEIAKVESRIQQKGGAWAKTRDEEKARQHSLISQQATLQGQILNELDGAFPLSLAPNAINNLIAELQNEQDLKDEQAFTRKFTQHSHTLAETLASQLKLDEAQITEALTIAASTFTSLKPSELTLDISQSNFHAIQTLRNDSESAYQRITEFNNELKATTHELEQLAVNIERAPDEDELHALYQELIEYNNTLTNEKAEYRKQLEQAKQSLTKALELAKKLEKRYTEQKNTSSVQKASARVEATHNVLTEFAGELTQLRVKQLEELFTQSYRKLARKNDLKLSASINSDTFDVNLVDQDGITINRKSMSAGEKQIFAFAILEALGKLSGKVLPVVVDTPLGRLDSQHRDKLIQNYFPDAAEQVILLSTDTEVDESFYELMKDSISHAYQIHFDETTRCSSLTEGYFWQQSMQEAR